MNNKRVAREPGAVSESTNIVLFVHCRSCLPSKPPSQSASQWSRLSAGITLTGVEIWCERCGVAVVHFTPELLQDYLARPPRCECCPGGLHNGSPAQ